LQEVQAAYAVLCDPKQRAAYDAKLRQEDEQDEKKDADLNAYLRSHHHRKTIKGSSGWLDAIWALLKLFK
jgi:curved DNA-binding protein CbpA